MQLSPYREMAGTPKGMAYSLENALPPAVSLFFISVA